MVGIGMGMRMGVGVGMRMGVGVGMRMGVGWVGRGPLEREGGSTGEGGRVFWRGREGPLEREGLLEREGGSTGEGGRVHWRGRVYWRGREGPLEREGGSTSPGTQPLCFLFKRTLREKTECLVLLTG
jgi:hypothetical protein